LSKRRLVFNPSRRPLWVLAFGGQVFGQSKKLNLKKLLATFPLNFLAKVFCRAPVVLTKYAILVAVFYLSTSKLEKR